MNQETTDKANTIYAKRLRHLMSTRGHITPTDVVKAANKKGINLNQETIFRILNTNKTAPKEETRAALAKLYDATKAQVVGDEPLNTGAVGESTLPYGPAETRKITEHMIVKAFWINGAPPEAMDNIDVYINVFEPAVAAAGDTTGMQETINRYIAEVIKQPNH